MSAFLTRAHHRGTAERPPIWLRGRVWLRRGALDQMLAAGADPNGSPELARRAAELTSFRHRRSLAAAIERAIEAAEHPPHPLSAAVPLERREILATRARLAQLAADLTGESPVPGDRISVSGERSALLSRVAPALSLKVMTPARSPRREREPEAAEELGVRGIALVKRLLTDGDSPLYAPYPAGELEQAVRHAHAALLLR
jgi:hypothetical protein